MPGPVLSRPAGEAAMRSPIRASLVILAGSALAVLPVSAETFRLKTGRVLHGDVQHADADGFQLKRFDNGGTLFVSWSAIAAADALRLRTAVLPDAAVERPTVKGVRLITDQQSVYEGLVVDENADKLILKAGVRKIPIPVKSIRHRVEIDIDADQVYTAEELYELKAAETDATTVEGNQLLAEYALSRGLAAKARAHYEKIKEIDPARKDAIDRLLEDFDKRMKEAEARRLRADLLVLAKEGKFEKVREILAKLKDGFAETEATRDLDEFAKKMQAEEELWKTKRDELLKKELIPAWYETMDRLIRRKVNERNVTLEAARAYVESNLDAEIKATLASKYSIKDADVDRFWSERQVPQPRSAAYGSGTWIIAGGQSGPIQLKAPAARQQPGSRQGGSTTRSTLERLLGGRTSSTRQPQQQAQPQVYKLDTPEEWWQSVSGVMRVDWLKAVFAEKALKVIQRKERPCAQCGGQGIFHRVSADGTEDLPCKRCHGTKNEVTVLYQ
jgi:hypothetical protein